MSKKELLLELASILRKNGYKIEEQKSITLKEFLDRAELSRRAHSLIGIHYLNKGLTFNDLLYELKTGEARKHSKWGHKTHEQIKEEVRKQGFYV